MACDGHLCGLRLHTCEPGLILISNSIFYIGNPIILIANAVINLTNHWWGCVLLITYIKLHVIHHILNITHQWLDVWYSYGRPSSVTMATVKLSGNQAIECYWHLSLWSLHCPLCHHFLHLLPQCSLLLCQVISVSLFPYSSPFPSPSPLEGIQNKPTYLPSKPSIVQMRSTTPCPWSSSQWVSLHPPEIGQGYSRSLQRRDT